MATGNSTISEIIDIINIGRELINVASQNRLRNPAVLEQQVRRMLADPKSSALVENFAAQYLYLRNLPATSPSSVFYPDWDHELRTGFKRETELLFDTIIRENRSVLDLLDANYTFVDVRSRIRRGEKVKHFETERRCKNSTLIPVSVTVSPIYGSTGTVVGASQIVRGITCPTR